MDENILDGSEPRHMDQKTRSEVIYVIGLLQGLMSGVSLANIERDLGQLICNSLERPVSVLKAVAGITEEKEPTK